MSDIKSKNITPIVGLAVAVSIAVAAVGWLLGAGTSQSPDQAAPAHPPMISGEAGPPSVSPDLSKNLQGEIDPHLQAMRARLTENPNDMEALLSIGYRYVERRAYTKARGYYLRASQVDPKNLEARTHLGTVDYFLGHVDEALHHYGQVLAYDPDYAVALFEMGAVLRYGKEDLPAAVETWEHFLAVDPEAEESGKIRELVAEARQMIADGWQPKPAEAPHAENPQTAPWPDEDKGAG